MTDQITKLEKEIKDLNIQKDSLATDRNKKDDEIRNSQEYKKITSRHEKLDKDSGKVYEDLKTLENEIKSRFFDIHDSWTSPSWSTTYGKNIYDMVISAIKRTFDFKRLSGSTIESITRNMFNYEIDNDERVIEKKRIKKEIEVKIWRIREELDTLLKNGTEEIQTKISKILGEIRIKEEEVISLKLLQGKDVKSKDLNNPYLKKSVQRDYRLECEEKFMKVFENFEKEKE